MLIYTVDIKEDFTGEVKLTSDIEEKGKFR